MYVCMYIYIYICIHIRKHVSLSLPLSLSLFIIYIYIYIYVYTHTYIHVMCVYIIYNRGMHQTLARMGTPPWTFTARGSEEDAEGGAIVISEWVQYIYIYIYIGPL